MEKKNKFFNALTIIMLLICAIGVVGLCIAQQYVGACWAFATAAWVCAARFTEMNKEKTIAKLQEDLAAKTESAEHYEYLYGEYFKRCEEKTNQIGDLAKQLEGLRAEVLRLQKLVPADAVTEVPAAKPKKRAKKVADIKAEVKGVKESLEK